jgi:hypothetical protein
MTKPALLGPIEFAPSTTCVIENCVFTNVIGGVGIYVQITSDCEVKDNVLEDSGAGIDLGSIRPDVVDRVFDDRLEPPVVEGLQEGKRVLRGPSEADLRGIE